MAKEKAKFFGTCQCCGHRQKLPNGVLSIHGYSVAFNFFMGTCRGSRRAPYEESCEYIKTEIQRIKGSIEDLKSKIADLNIDKNSDIGIVNGIEQKIIYSQKKESFLYVTCRSGGNLDYKEHLIDFLYHGKNPKTVEEAAFVLNKIHGKNLGQHVAKYEGYIKWQEERIANWVPKELEAI